MGLLWYLKLVRKLLDHVVFGPWAGGVAAVLFVVPKQYNVRVVVVRRVVRVALERGLRACVALMLVWCAPCCVRIRLFLLLCFFPGLLL